MCTINAVDLKVLQRQAALREGVRRRFLVFVNLSFEPFNKDYHTVSNDRMDSFRPFVLFPGEKIKSYNTIEQAPDGILRIPEIDGCGKLAVFNTLLKYVGNNFNIVVGRADKFPVLLIGKTHLIRMQHKGHQYSE